MKRSALAELDSKDFFVVALIATLVFFVSNISFISIDTPFSGKNLSEIFYIRTLVDFSGLVILFALREQKLWLHAQGEIDAMQSILNKHYEQYMTSREQIEVLNRKYHDIKHMIGIIRAEENSEKKKGYLDEMEAGIKLYEAQNKTGNAVLDTVVNSKSILCAAKGITFTIVADGTLLDFMDVMDICSIFGNALDNAVESVEKVSEKDKRIMKLSVYQQNTFLLIRFENYFENELRYEGENLATTKADKFYHGFGVKSIKSIVEKYEGSVVVSANGNWFTLCALIPIKPTF
jgi:sensor histidine kinase regulating citrate/malate metabolism